MATITTYFYTAPVVDTVDAGNAAKIAISNTANAVAAFAINADSPPTATPLPTVTLGPLGTNTSVRSKQYHFRTVDVVSSGSGSRPLQTDMVTRVTVSIIGLTVTSANATPDWSCYLTPTAWLGPSAAYDTTDTRFSSTSGGANTNVISRTTLASNETIQLFDWVASSGGANSWTDSTKYVSGNFLSGVATGGDSDFAWTLFFGANESLSGAQLSHVITFRGIKMDVEYLTLPATTVSTINMVGVGK